MAKARLSIPDSEYVWIQHPGAFGDQYFGEHVLLVQRDSQFDRMGFSWSESFAATALAHSSRIRSSNLVGMT
jgi:hypothetical protein